MLNPARWQELLWDRASTRQQVTALLSFLPLLTCFHLLYQDDLRTAGAKINTDVSRRAGQSVSNSHHFDPACISPVTGDHCKRKLLWPSLRAARICPCLEQGWPRELGWMVWAWGGLGSPYPPALRLGLGGGGSWTSCSNQIQVLHKTHWMLWL